MSRDERDAKTSMPRRADEPSERDAEKGKPRRADEPRRAMMPRRAGRDEPMSLDERDAETSKPSQDKPTR